MSLLSHPIKKLTLLAAFGGGYVLGAKAGRERYEQIKQTAQQVADDPRVQQASAQAQEFVRETAEKVKDDPRVQDVAERVQGAAHLATDKAEEAVDVASSDVHPLLADEHFESVDPVVYSTGDDIEESIDELAGVDATEQTLTHDKQGDA